MLGLGLNFGSSQSGSSAARMGGPGLLLDTYGSAAAAYSLRKLNSSYDGKVLQVRRASDHVEVDVGFDSNGLLSLDSPVTNVTEESTGITQGSSTNAAKLGEFCGEARRSGGDTSYATVDSMTEAAHVEVVTWYDQSGNTRNATQAAAASQPRVYDRSSGLIVENGKPAVEFNGDKLGEFNLSISQPYSFNYVGRYAGNTASAFAPFFGSRSTTFVSFMVRGNNWMQQSPNLATNSTTVDTNQHNWFLLYDGASSFVGVDGGTAATSNPGTSALENFAIGSRGTDGAITELRYFQELVLWGSDQSGTPQSGIETNINTFYSIY